jgi:membrane-bound lytic murein transglycosylase D
MYGLTLPEVPNRPYFVSVKTSHDIDVDVAARLAGMPLEEFKALNPSFRKPLIVGSSESPILLPFDNAQDFERNLRAHDGPLSSWTTYTVTTRETPAALARRIGVDADTLISINKIPAGMRLKPGSTLLVPKTGEQVDDISADVLENAVLSIEPDLPDTHKVLVRVRKRETITQLALRYNVSVGQIQSWNKTRRTSFAPGQAVLLHLPVDRPLPQEPAPPRVIQAAVAPRQPAGGFERIGTVRVEATMGRGGIMRVSEPVGKSVAAKKEKGAALRGKLAAGRVGAASAPVVAAARAPVPKHGSAKATVRALSVQATAKPAPTKSGKGALKAAAGSRTKPVAGLANKKHDG